MKSMPAWDCPAGCRKTGHFLGYGAIGLAWLRAWRMWLGHVCPLILVRRWKTNFGARLKKHVLLLYRRHANSRYFSDFRGCDHRYGKTPQLLIFPVLVAK
jgi:hypothetical protein